MESFVYRGDARREISFPLGGIGTGCVGLAGDGRLIDWEIFNRPNKQSDNGFTGFAVRAEKDGQVQDIRVLQGPLVSMRMGNADQYGYGPSRTSLGGFPHFRDNTFVGDFPIATLTFDEPAFPGKAKMRAFNPFIPLEADDSSLPAAFFEITIENLTDAALDYTVYAFVHNPVKLCPVNRQVAVCDRPALLLTSTEDPCDLAQWGELCLACDAETASMQTSWYRGAWFDNLGMFWNDIQAPGPLRAREYDAPNPHGGETGVLAAHITAKAGEVARVRFVLAWHFPNCYTYWRRDASPVEEAHAQWRNHYATRFARATDTATYALSAFGRLLADTERFQQTLYQSSLPRVALEAVAANLSLLKSPTCLRLENGEFYGWEGVAPHTGSCEGSCTHVWNYAYALPYLFPSLERSMRELNYTYNADEHGRMSFRLMLPLSAPLWGFKHACCDGQFGDVLKMYREWRICGDTAWLAKYWPQVKASIEYAWSEYNVDAWDRDHDGVLEGRQHHTLDMELFGPNAWLTGFYLAALKAGAEMADAMGEPETAAAWRALFARGKAWTDEHLFNGEYYAQNVDLSDRKVLEAFQTGPASMSGDVIKAYWHEEHNQLKYQIGEGCGIDQVLAQWHADLIGLGEIFDPAQVESSLRAIYRHNFKERLGDVFNPCRLYGLEDESGTLICAYPKDREKPQIAVPYAEETMHGFEYQVASHMILRGQVEEGLRLVKAVRDRYDGAKRNPWDEMECGANYSRSMASYALLLAFSGFHYDAVEKHLSVKPIGLAAGFRSFFCTEGAWGECSYDGKAFSLTVTAGALRIRRWATPVDGTQISGITLSGAPVAHSLDMGAAIFDEVTVAAGQTVSLLLR